MYSSLRSYLHWFSPFHIIYDLLFVVFSPYNCCLLPPQPPPPTPPNITIFSVRLSLVTSFHFSTLLSFLVYLSVSSPLPCSPFLCPLFLPPLSLSVFFIERFKQTKESWFVTFEGLRDCLWPMHPWTIYMSIPCVDGKWSIPVDKYFKKESMRMETKTATEAVHNIIDDRSKHKWFKWIRVKMVYKQ